GEEARQGAGRVVGAPVDGPGRRVGAVAGSGSKVEPAPFWYCRGVTGPARGVTGPVQGRRKARAGRYEGVAGPARACARPARGVTRACTRPGPREYYSKIGPKAYSIERLFEL